MDMEERRSSISHFLQFRHWEEAVKLLEKQVSLMEEGKNHFNTLSMKYYSSHDYPEVSTKEFFSDIVESQLFYALSDRFNVKEYPKPKSDGVRIRRYKFLTYPMRLVHHSIGVYLMELTRDFRNNYYDSIEEIDGRFGSSLRVNEDNRLGSVEREDIYFWNHYKRFTQDARELIESGSENRVILHFDISDYYDNLSVRSLLENIKKINNESENVKRGYDEQAINTICEIYDVISKGQGGIPQTDNNIISSFMGNLYMMYSDLHVDDIVSRFKTVNDHYLIRWVDDTYLSLDFDHNLGSYDRDKISTNVAQLVSESLVEKLGLRINPKTRLFRAEKTEERGEYISNLLKTSVTEDLSASLTNIVGDGEEIEEKYFGYISDYPQGSANKIISTLRRLSHRNEEYEDIDPDFSRIDRQSKEALKMIYDKNVNNLMKSEKYSKKLRDSLKKIDFDLVYLSVNPILTMIEMFEDISNNLEEHFLNKSRMTLPDVWVCLNYLLNIGLPKNKLYKKISREAKFGDILKGINDKYDKKNTGYYDIPLPLVRTISRSPHTIYQIKKRKISEMKGNIGVSTNHLLNEIHSICFTLDGTKDEMKDYNVNDVVNFLNGSDTPHGTVLSVRKLFDLRNINPLSHPGSTQSPSKVAGSKEYLSIKESVGSCIEHILSVHRK